MTTILKGLSWLCFGYCAFYIVVSLRTYFWVGTRHEGRLFFLELQPQRALGTTEAARARQLRRMRWLSLLAFPLGVALLFASLLLG